jgi:uncharacterized protein (TIGR04255 family)
MQSSESERVIYQRNPLIQVACQLRFPPILKVSHQEPVEFQDRVRYKYPLFERVQVQIPTDISQLIQQAGIPLTSNLSYNFTSEDQRWQLFLGREFITISTSEYERYEHFQSRFQEVLEIFEQIYEPSYYTRVGIQYQDLIVRSKLGLNNEKWSNLITRCIASELHDSEFLGSIQSITKNLILKIENGQVNFKHGLVTVKETEKSNDEEAYLIDADFYTEDKVEGDENVWRILNDFNRAARQLFRKSITNTLHNAMYPKSVESINS